MNLSKTRVGLQSLSAAFKCLSGIAAFALLFCSCTPRVDYTVIKERPAQDEVDALDPSVQQLWNTINEREIAGEPEASYIDLLKKADKISEYESSGRMIRRYLFVMEQNNGPHEGTLLMMIYVERSSQIITGCVVGRACD